MLLFLLATALRICQHEGNWPIRAWHQNLVSWNGGIKGMSPGSAALSPSPIHPLGSPRSLRSFLFHPVFCIFPHCSAWSKASRRCIVERGSVSARILRKWSLLELNTSQPGHPTLTAMLWIPSLTILELQTFFPASSETPQVRGGEKRVLF